jgi:hypothetical protein
MMQKVMVGAPADAAWLRIGITEHFSEHGRLYRLSIFTNRGVSVASGGPCFGNGRFGNCWQSHLSWPPAKLIWMSVQHVHAKVQSALDKRADDFLKSIYLMEGLWET